MSEQNVSTRAVAKRPDERREELLDAAMTLFTTQGLDNTSVQNITDAVGVAKGLFYHYFDSKEEALLAAVELYSDRFLAELPQHAGEMDGGPLDKIRTVIGRIIDWKWSERADMTAEYARVMYRPENFLLRTKLAQSYTYVMVPLFSEIIAEGVETGECDVDDPVLAAEAVFAMWLGSAEQLGAGIVILFGDASAIGPLLDKVRSIETSIERILGIEAGTLRLYDYDFLEKALGTLAASPQPDDGIPPPAEAGTDTGAA